MIYMGIYAGNFATNFTITLNTSGLPQPTGLDLNLNPISGKIKLKKTSKDIQFPG